MTRKSRLFGIVAVAALALTGCNEGVGPTEPEDESEAVAALGTVLEHGADSGSAAVGTRTPSLPEPGWRS